MSWSDWIGVVLVPVLASAVVLGCAAGILVLADYLGWRYGSRRPK